jgi:hypothetical protein
MIKINGTNTVFNFDVLTKVKDLIYYDGPLLSHFVNEHDNYLFYWVDLDDQYNRWLFYKVSEDSLQNYIDKKITLYELMNNLSNDIYSVDIDNDINYCNVKQMSISEIDPEYLPETNSYII